MEVVIVDNVDTQFVEIADERSPFEFESGEVLAPVTLAYEVYGELNAPRDNAILVFHALTGSHHAAGFNAEVPGVGDLWTDELKLGWWDAFIGSRRAFNTDKFAVICANYVGGCYGSTGPASINPVTSKPYGGGFPSVTVGDIVESQVRLLDHLGIERLHAVAGGSVGGMMCLDLATRYPERVKYVIPIAAGLRATPLHIIFNFEQTNAILNDPNFADGNFYEGPRPDEGLSLARMIGHKTFVSLSAMEARARNEVPPATHDRVKVPLESYMWHQGTKFVRRFDANTYLRTMEMWQRFDLERAAEEKGTTPTELLGRGSHHEYMVFSIDSDVCFYAEEQQELVATLEKASIPVRWITVHSDKGHDSFLLEPELFTPHLRYLLEEEWDPA